MTKDLNTVPAVSQFLFRMSVASWLAVDHQTGAISDDFEGLVAGFACRKAQS